MEGLSLGIAGEGDVLEAGEVGGVVADQPTRREGC
jgi:hypothetical protein